MSSWKDLGGEYELSDQIDKATAQIFNEKTAKRLLMAMQFGIVISHADGHRWIYSYPGDALDGYRLNKLLRDKGLPEIRHKCYGTVIDALDRVDGALKALGHPTLEEHYFPEAWV